jgi:hypothetical protein
MRELSGKGGTLRNPTERQFVANYFVRTLHFTLATTLNDELYFDKMLMASAFYSNSTLGRISIVLISLKQQTTERLQLNTLYFNLTIISLKQQTTERLQLNTLYFNLTIISLKQQTTERLQLNTLYFNLTIICFCSLWVLSKRNFFSEFRSGEVYSIQHYVIQFFGDFRQVDGFVRVLRFPPPIKLTTTIYLKCCWKWH